MVARSRILARRPLRGFASAADLRVDPAGQLPGPDPVRPQSGVETRRPQGSRGGAARERIGERSGVSRSGNLQSCLSESLSYQSVVRQGRATGGSGEDEAEEFVPSENLVGFA